MEECRRRVIQESSTAWGNLSADERKAFGLKAKQKNKQAKSMQRVAARRDEQIVQDAREEGTIVSIANECLVGGDMLPEYVPSSGYGAMGLGDDHFGLAEQTVKQQDEFFPGFVSTFSTRWRNQSGTLTSATPDVLSVKPYKMSCLVQFLIMIWCQNEVLSLTNK